MMKFKTLLVIPLSVLYLLHCSNASSSSAYNNNNNNNQQQSSTTSALTTQQTTTTTTSKPTYLAEPPRRQQVKDDEYLIGVGIADITGPSADINLVSLIRQLATASSGSTEGEGSSGSSPSMTGAGNSGAVSQSSASSAGAASSGAEEIMRIEYPSWRDLQDVKLQLKINFNSLLLQTQSLNSMLRWAMPNQIKMQAEFTYANIVVQL